MVHKISQILSVIASLIKFRGLINDYILFNDVGFFVITSIIGGALYNLYFFVEHYNYRVTLCYPTYIVR
jgi:hypothetical protein